MKRNTVIQSVRSFLRAPESGALYWLLMAACYGFGAGSLTMSLTVLGHPLLGLAAALVCVLVLPFVIRLAIVAERAACAFEASWGDFMATRVEGGKPPPD